MAAVASSLGPPVPARWVVPTVAVFCAGAALTAGLEIVDGPVTTYAATSPLALVADLAAGLGMISAGAALWMVRPGVPAVLAVLIGCAWMADDWVGNDAATPVVRSVAMVATPFLLALVAHLVLTWSGGRAKRPRVRAAVIGAYAVATVVALGQAILRDPLFDRHCWRNCTDNTFLLRADVDIAQVLAGLRLWSGVATGVLIVAVVSWSTWRGSPAARAVSVPVLVPAALVATAEAGYAAVLLRVPEEDPSAALFLATFYARAAALTALAVGLAWAAARTAHTRRAVGRLAVELAGARAPGRFRDVLARSIGDDRLEVAYWLDGPRRFVDEDGCAVDPRPAHHQVATTITRADRTIAVVIHDRTLLDTQDLKRHIGAAARLAVDNERLRAEVLYRLQDLRASQARVVARSDSTRRRLERDLHDGAQQRLLSVSFELRLALVDARSRGDAELTTILTWASAEVGRALAELRELAQGIFPAILADAGLGPALRGFAMGAAVPVDVVSVVDDRVDPEAEHAAYVVVIEAVADALRRSAGYVTVQIDHADRQLVVSLSDDGSTLDRTHLPHVVDRVGALGGTLGVGASGLRAVIPCA